MAFNNPNVNLPIPQVGDPGTPAYQEATNVMNEACNLTHTGPANNDGPILNQNALDFTGDLPLDGYNLTNVRSFRCIDESAALIGVNDVNCFYTINGNAYFNNASGVAVQITSGNTIISGSFLSFTSQSATNTNLTILASAVYNLINVSTTTTAVTITLPVAATLANGRFFYINDVGNNAQNNNITIQIASGSGNVLNANGSTSSSVIINSNGGSCIVYTDGSNNFYFSSFSQLIYTGQTIELITSELEFATGSSLVQVNSASASFGGTNNFTSGSTANFEAGSTVEMAAFPNFQSAQTRNLVQSVGIGSVYSFIATSWTNYGTYIVSGSSDGNQWQIPLIRTHNGATLSQIVISFQVGVSHAGVPAQLPTMTVYQMPYTSITGSKLSSVDPQSNFALTPFGAARVISSGSNWYNSNNLQYMQYNCNQNDVIDNTNYHYVAIIEDESGANGQAGNTYYSVCLVFNTINNLSWSM